MSKGGRALRSVSSRRVQGQRTRQGKKNMQRILSATLPHKHFVKALMPTADRKESQACYPHRRHPEGPALAVPLLFHQHLVDTVELPGYLARPAAGSTSAGRAALGEEASKTLGGWGAWDGRRPRGPR